MATLHFQPHGSAIASISSSHPRSNPARISCCFNFLPLGLKASSPARFNFRLKDSVTLLLTRKLSAHNASKSDSSETSDASKGSEAYAGPPFLTILAGILVFLSVFWAFGSFIVWLFSLIVKVPSLK